MNKELLINELFSPLDWQIIGLISLALTVVSILLQIRYDLKNIPWKKLAKNTIKFGPSVFLCIVTCFAMFISFGAISQAIGAEYPIKFNYAVLLEADNYSTLAIVDVFGIAISFMIVGPLSALATYCDFRKCIAKGKLPK